MNIFFDNAKEHTEKIKMYTKNRDSGFTGKMSSLLK